MKEAHFEKKIIKVSARKIRKTHFLKNAPNSYSRIRKRLFSYHRIQKRLILYHRIRSKSIYVYGALAEIS
jgi:capsule polysaccharide modification protein KpsS